MTAEVPTAAAGGWLTRLDPGHVALERAVRVTIAACLAFYPLRYGLDDPISALYAVFTVISLGALSDVQGAPATRTGSYLGALAAGAVLVTAGTLAAINTAVAVAGMLLVGFTVAYSGVGGPRLVGVANGLQLFYILPCFPPYAPDTLDQRLLGLVIGGGLIVAADRLLWPPPGPPPPGDRLAVAADRIAAFAYSLRGMLHDPTAASEPERAARRDALDAAARLRLAEIPLPERPLGPGVRDRGLLAAFAATRMTAGRIAALADLLAEPDRTAHPRTADLLGVTAEVFAELAAAVRAGGSESGPAASISTSGLDAALRRYRDDRARHFADHPHSASDLRAGLAAEAVVEDSRIAVLGVGGFLGAQPPDPPATPPALWFLHVSRGELVWRRLRAHLTPRSVYLQNAVRLALGLAAARVIAGVFDLSHGFWVLLATLSLMRTSAFAGRAVLRRALGGTLIGAVVAAALLAAVGPATDVYAWALPPLMVLAFAAGPVFGVAAGQAGFTVVVAVLFAQVAPTTWQLAEVRVADVLIGGLIGALIGAAVWPRGGGGEVRRAAAEGLQAGAATVRETIALLAGTGPAPSKTNLSQSAVLFEQAYMQFRTEPTGPAGPDWLVVLGVVQRIDNYASVLRTRQASGPLPAPDAAADLCAAADEVAAGYAAAAEAISAGDPAAAGASARLRQRLDDIGGPALGAAGAAPLRLVEGWAWLQGLVADLARLEQATTAATAPRP